CRTARRSPSCASSRSGCAPSSHRFSATTRAPRCSIRRCTTSAKKVMTQAPGTSRRRTCS
ncbi:MAG: hypothetical protein AVDCRST_MAG47-1381, partial [uncultured Nocardioidaceae bacterium]